MAFRKLLDLVLPLECAGCLRPGRGWCPRCDRALSRLGFPYGPQRVTPRPCPPELPDVVTWGHYAEPLRSVITAWKDEGRRDLQAVLEPFLACALRAALDEFQEVAHAGPAGPLIVPAPSSRRSRRVRGDIPLHALAVRAARRVGPPADGAVLPVLEQRRGVSDQAGLTILDRRDNVAGAFTVGRRWRPAVKDRAVLVVDDVMTTGATIAECSRALYEHGASVVVAATVAATRRRRGTVSSFGARPPTSRQSLSRSVPGAVLPPVPGAG